MTQEVDLAITDVVNEAVLNEGGNVGNTTVSLTLDTLQQIESHLITRHYDGFLKSGKIQGRSRKRY